MKRLRLDLFKPFLRSTGRDMSIVSDEQTAHEIALQDEDCYGYKLTEITVDDVTHEVTRKLIKRVAFGQLLTREQMQTLSKEQPDNEEYASICQQMEKNGYDKVIHARMGKWFEYEDDIEVVDPSSIQAS